MREYVLVGDSTEDLNVDVLKTLDVKILTFTYSVNDEVIPYYMDERDGDIKDFYDRLRKGSMPVTSQINPDSYKKAFEVGYEGYFDEWAEFIIEFMINRFIFSAPVSDDALDEYQSNVAAALEKELLKYKEDNEYIVKYCEILERYFV